MFSEMSFRNCIFGEGMSTLIETPYSRLHIKMNTDFVLVEHEMALLY